MWVGSSGRDSKRQQRISDPVRFSHSLGILLPLPIPSSQVLFLAFPLAPYDPKGRRPKEKGKGKKEERRQSQGYFAPAKSPETPFWAKPSAATPPSSFVLPQKLVLSGRIARQKRGWEGRAR